MRPHTVQAGAKPNIMATFMLSVGTIWPAIDHKLPCPLIIPDSLCCSLRPHIVAGVPSSSVGPIRVCPCAICRVLLLSPGCWHFSSIRHLQQSLHFVSALESSALLPCLSSRSVHGPEPANRYAPRFLFVLNVYTWL